MNQINQLTNSSRQNQILVLADGTSFNITIYFVPMQYGWFITNLTYGEFVLNNIRICNIPNLLQQFRNQLPFGLACFSVNEREPSQQDDFVSGASSLYVLTAAEVRQYSEFLSA